VSLDPFNLEDGQIRASDHERSVCQLDLLHDGGFAFESREKTNST